MAGVDWTDSTTEAAGAKLHVSRAGRGRPVMILHHETGTLDRLPFYDALAAHYDVLVPHYPGYSRSQRPEWMRSVRDIAVIYRGLLADLGLRDAALVGLGFGGWIAAEMASMAPADLSHLVLVGAMGIKPPQGDILDLAVTGYVDYARAGFHDQKAFDRVYGAEPSVDQLEMWDICREMSFRIAWKPYMYSQTLPHLLGSVRAPALVVWGDDDKVVPQSAAKHYVEALPNAKLEIVKASGHCVDMEHHDAPFCMQAKANIFAAILAGMTQKVKIVMLGNPLPLAENPVRLAEELAMIDMISKGRLVSGFVRGGGQEQLATGVNPAFNRDRFEEAHDLIVAAWTRQGPIRWEGRHYQNRVVNPWAVPLQKPYPRVWIPGVLSQETIIWAADHGYPYIALNTPVERTKQIWKFYDDAAAEAGFTAGPDYHGLLKQIHVAETEEKAIENARQFMWMQGEFTGLAHPVWSTPSGYGSPENRQAFVEFATGRSKNPRYRPPLEKQLEEMMIIAGTPKQVIARLRVLLQETRPGILGLWGNDGSVTHQDA